MYVCVCLKEQERWFSRVYVTVNILVHVGLEVKTKDLQRRVVFFGLSSLFNRRRSRPRLFHISVGPCRIRRFFVSIWVSEITSCRFPVSSTEVPEGGILSSVKLIVLLIVSFLHIVQFNFLLGTLVFCSFFISLRPLFEKRNVFFSVDYLHFLYYLKLLVV